LLFAPGRAKANQPFLGIPPQEMVAALVGRGNLRPLEGLVHLLAGELPSAAEGQRKRLSAPRKYLVVETECFPAPPAGREDAWREEGQHPPDIVPCDEVQSAPHGPGADDCPIRQRLFNVRVGDVARPQPNRPLRPKKILGLHRAQPGDDFRRMTQHPPTNQLICDSIPGHVSEVMLL
jgi:hypothetical protein